MEHGSEETTGHSQSFLPSLGGRQFDKAGTDAKRSTGLGACSQAEAPLEGLPRPYRDPQGCWDTPRESALGWDFKQSFESIKTAPNTTDILFN